MFTAPAINRGSRQAEWLRYCWPMMSGFAWTRKELMQGAHLTNQNTGNLAAGPRQDILTPLYNGTSHTAQAAINLGDVATLTLTCWLYWDAFANNDDLAFEYTNIYYNSSTGEGNGWIFNANDSAVSACTVGCGGTSGARVKSFVRPSAAAWHHYVILFDRAATNGIPAVYIDGKSVTLTNVENTTILGNFRASSNLSFMCRNAASLFGAGRLCDVRIYAGKLLSQPEAYLLYDPRTRWDLYQQVEERRVWSIPGGAVTPPETPKTLLLLGVGQ